MNAATLEVSDGKETVVHIEGRATIDFVAEIHHTFQEALALHLPLVLDLNNVTEYDSSFIQLVRSLCYTLNNGGHLPLQFSQDILPEKLTEMVRLTGFQFHPLCTRTDNVDCVCYKLANPIAHSKETPQ